MQILSWYKQKQIRSLYFVPVFSRRTEITLKTEQKIDCSKMITSHYILNNYAAQFSTLDALHITLSKVNCNLYNTFNFNFNCLFKMF